MAKRGKGEGILATPADGLSVPRLSDEFVNGPSAAAVRHGGEIKLSKVAVRYIFWARAEGVALKAVANDLGVPYGTVMDRIYRLRNSPTDELYNCGFVVAVHTGENEVWTKYLCRFCLATFKRMIDAGAHAFRHLYDDGDNIMPKQRHS